MNKFSLFISLSIFFFTSCFSYQKELAKYDPQDFSYLNKIEDGFFTPPEMEILNEMYRIAPNSTKPNQLKFMLYLYKKEYDISYLNDTINSYERKEEFSKHFYQWFRNEKD